MTSRNVFSAVSGRLRAPGLSRDDGRHLVLEPAEPAQLGAQDGFVGQAGERAGVSAPRAGRL
jgi:hypothetical protein